MISKEWVEESTQRSLPPNSAEYYPEYFSYLPGQGYYQYMWWGMARPDASCDYAAEGDKGQFIYVSPHKNLVIIRNGIEEGISSIKWFQLFYQFASQY